MGYSPGVAVINDMIVGIENRDGNTNVRFNQKETLERIFKRLEASEVYISRARMDCGSCSEEIVDMVEAHCRHFYIHANRCSSFYDSMFTLTGWKLLKYKKILRSFLAQHRQFLLKKINDNAIKRIIDSMTITIIMLVRPLF